MRRCLRWGAATVALALAFPALVACSDDDDGTALEESPDRETSDSTTTSTSTPPDLSQVSLVPVPPGKPVAVTRPRTPGTASIAGRVIDDRGTPVPGALVRAGYYLDPNAPEILETLSGGDGGFRFEALYGGSWRLRAWQEPGLATLESAAIFLGAGEHKALDLKVKNVPAVAVTSNVAPNPPLVGIPAELAVLVVSQVVDSDGRVQRTRVGGAGLTLFVEGAWSLAPGSENPATTASDGTARWQLVCGAEGTQPAAVEGLGGTFPIKLPACLSPASTSTTTITTLAPGATTTTTKKTPKATTTTTRDPKVTTTTKARRQGE